MPQIGETWVHSKTLGHYKIIKYTWLADGPSLVLGIIYQHVDGGGTFCRSLSNFLETPRGFSEPRFHGR